MSSRPYNFIGLFIACTVFSLVFWHWGVVYVLLTPVRVFVTTLHELAHAIACIVTGGQVTGLTIVSDNQGHGGLTMCSGGNPIIYAQAGYLGTAVFGCLFIILGQYPRASKIILFLMGSLIVVASVLLMPPGLILEGRMVQALASMLWGLVIGVALILGSIRLGCRSAHLLLTFLSVQTALNCLSDLGILFGESTGLQPGSVSDADSMALLTGVPAFLWSGLWTVSALTLLALTIWYVYLRPGPAITAGKSPRG